MSRVRPGDLPAFPTPRDYEIMKHRADRPPSAQQRPPAPQQQQQYVQSPRLPSSISAHDLQRPPPPQSNGSYPRHHQQHNNGASQQPSRSQSAQGIRPPAGYTQPRPGYDPRADGVGDVRRNPQPIQQQQQQQHQQQQNMRPQQPPPLQTQHQHQQQQYDARHAHDGLRSPNPNLGMGAGAGVGGQPAQQKPRPDSLGQLFASVDSDGSGRITARELGLALPEYRFEPEVLSLLCRAFDAHRDKDGKLGCEGFRRLARSCADWRQTFEAYAVSSGLSAAGVRVLGPHEFAQAITGLGYRLSQQFLGALFKRHDRRGAKECDLARFIAANAQLKMLTDIFRRFDADQDGVITIDFESFLDVTTEMM